MFRDDVLHDAVVAVGVDADVTVVGEGECHDVVKHMVDFRETGDAVDNMIGRFIVEPLPFVDDPVGGFRRSEEGEIRHHPILLHHHKAPSSFHVGGNDLLRGIAIVPLVGIPRPAHRLSGSIHHRHDGGDIGRCGRPDYSVSHRHVVFFQQSSLYACVSHPCFFYRLGVCSSSPLYWS